MLLKENVTIMSTICSPPEAPWSCLCDQLTKLATELKNTQTRSFRTVVAIADFLEHNHDAIVNQFAACAWSHVCDGTISAQAPLPHLSGCMDLPTANFRQASKHPQAFQSPSSGYFDILYDVLEPLLMAIMPGCCRPHGNRAGFPYFLTELSMNAYPFTLLPTCVPMTTPVSKETYAVFATKDQCEAAIPMHPNPPPMPPNYKYIY